MRENLSSNINNLVDQVLLGRYKILSLMGCGGVKATYLAVDEQGNRICNVAAYEKGHKSFDDTVITTLSEIYFFLKKLDHPMIPEVIDIIENDHYLFVIGEGLQGKTLSAVLEEQRKIPEEIVCRWAEDLCGVLQYLYSQDPPCFYRILAPGNIWICPDGSLKLIGLEDACIANLNKSNFYPLTRGYLAPEGFGAWEDCDVRTDIYSLGAVLFHLVTGVDPGQAPYEIKPIRQLDRSLSRNLEYVIDKCVKLDPADRFQNYEELLRALRQDYPDAQAVGFWKRLTRLKWQLEMNNRYRKSRRND